MITEVNIIKGGRQKNNKFKTIQIKTRQNKQKERIR